MLRDTCVHLTERSLTLSVDIIADFPVVFSSHMFLLLIFVMKLKIQIQKHLTERGH